MTQSWISRVLGPGRPELSCDECFSLVDQYVEAEVARARADERFPGMEAHLEGCSACRDEHELLREYALTQEH